MKAKRDYTVGDGQLITIATRVLVGARRDVAELTPFGWPQARVDALESAQMALIDLPIDGEFTAIGMGLREDHRALRKEAARYVTVEVMTRVNSAFGPGSMTALRFRVEEIHLMDDFAFLLLLNRVARQASALLPRLAPKGLTQAHIDTVLQYAPSFFDSLIAIDTFIDDRDKAHDDRIEAGNAFYHEMKELCDLGKRLWFNVDPSRYNEYIIYPGRNRAGRAKAGA
ncbi:MAG: hypothetical protein K9J06_01400 [Flavobacteriales bacterium]|nr:hypothetical protein [Flavobacteriales bacterium]